MAFQAIESIKDAERDATVIVAEARKRAAQMLKDGKVKADATIESARDKVEEKSLRMIDEAKKSCEKEVDKLKEKYREDGILLEQSAGKNMDRAVDSIVERIVTQYGNS